MRARIRPLYLGAAGKLAREAVEQAEARRGDVEAVKALEANVMGAKGWNALGAFDPTERSRALDLLGFSRQLVFSTFAATQFAGDDLFLFSSDYPHPEGGRDPIRRFESSLEGIGGESKARFYAGNFAAMMGM